MPENNQTSILITAGGTQEDIDAVRSITNHSTGRLGSLIADTFIKNSANVTYICSETSLLPTLNAHEVIKVRNTSQLMETLDRLLCEKSYDCIIHSMAVSDFTPYAVIAVDEWIRDVCREFCEKNPSEEEMHMWTKDYISSRNIIPAPDKKLSSKHAELMLVMRQTSKVISRIKAMQPGTLLVGFKLLSGATESELLKTGLDLMANNNCDYVLVNDSRTISRDRHMAILLNKDGPVCQAETKQGIAQMIYERVTKEIDK